ncbi:MAG: GNAT family N-acetyltransferase [Burkholderiaceae bacterium]
MNDIQIRATQREDIAELVALQRRIYPEIEPWLGSRVEHQLDVFPEGQFVAMLGERLVGCASSIIVDWDDWLTDHTWTEITADGTFETHTPTGLTLYGAEVFVDPAIRGQRVGHLLYNARRRLCRRLNLKRIIACGRLPGYHRHADAMAVETYAMKVVWGDLKDPVLNFQLREGFDFCGVIRDYLPEDVESCGHAALIVWLNPSYRPKRRPGASNAPDPLPPIV